jgi:alkylation response protein AidB-like acyl-CoA dehydrogenase
VNEIVDLDLSDDQQIFQSTARRFLEREVPMSRVRAFAENNVDLDRELWARAAELGWFGCLVPEADGGGSVSGAPVVDASLVAEEAGRALLPGPLMPSTIAAYAIAAVGSASQRAKHLPALVGGQHLATNAFAEDTGRWDVQGIAMQAVDHGRGFRLSGTKSFVQDANAVDLLVVTARTTGGLTQFLVPRETPGIAVRALESLDLARGFADVEFDAVDIPADAVLGEVGHASETFELQCDIATVLVCSETVGALDRCYEMTLEYARARKAFGRPIASFQALKHRLADMLLWLEGAKAITAAAAQAIDLDVDRAETVSIAKSYVSDRGPVIARDCLQMHGGIGYTWEFDLHFLLRRVDSNAALYGGVDHHRDRLADLLGLGDGAPAR